MLVRQGDPVFHLSPAKADQISDQIVTRASTLVAHRQGQRVREHVHRRGEPERGVHAG